MNKRNYRKEMDDLIGAMKLTMDAPVSERPKLLLHACCAPCSSAVLEELARLFQITVYYYNPNITDSTEYEKRTVELHRLVTEMEGQGVFLTGSVKVVNGPYEPACFLAFARDMAELPEGGERCRRCYELRMEESARYAAENGFDFFTTTLSISPLKNVAWINEIGERLAGEYGVKHLPSEFRKKGGYLRSIELSKEYDLYRQDYCGCAFSKAEAEKRRR